VSAAPERERGHAADATATRALVLGIGEAVVSLDRRLSAFERMLAEVGKTPESRREQMHLLPPPGRVRTTRPRRPPLYVVPAEVAQ
jgi:hypothetical protein